MNKSKRKRLVKNFNKAADKADRYADKANAKIARLNRQLHEQLNELRQAVRWTDDPAEKEKGRAMIRRLERELGITSESNGEARPQENRNRPSPLP